MQLLPATTCKVVMTCAVLHNMAVRARLPILEMLPLDEEDEEDNIIHGNQDGVAIRNMLIQNRFTY